MFKTLLLVLIAAFAASCSKPTDPAHALLDAFVDAYVHHADPVKARALAAGDALQRLDGEIAAVTGQERPPDGPEVEFSITREQSRNDTLAVELEVRIRSAGAPAFTRDLLITATPVQGTWKVVDYLFLK